MPSKRVGTKKPKSAARGAAATSTSSRNITARVAAITKSPLEACDSDDKLQSMLKVLRDTAEPIDVRLATLQALQAAAFSVVAFESCRGDYMATLRAVAEDADPELRQRVLGLLAREKDGFAQQKLLEGLKNPEKALVAPEKALQLLSYDVHADAYPVARAIIKNPPNPEAKREALRLLAADAASAPMFEKMLRDKDELAEIRQISASALHALQPAKMQAQAREMLLDTKEYPEIQATSLSALTNFGDAGAISADKPLMKRVTGLSGGPANKVKRTARQFLDKYDA